MYLHNKGHNYYRQQWWVGLYNTQMNNIPYLYCTTYLSEGVVYIYQRRKIESGYLSGSAEMNLYVYVPQHIFQTADYHAALSVPLQETTLKWTCVKSRYIEQLHIYITLWNGTEVFPHCNVSYRSIIRVILYPVSQKSHVTCPSTSIHLLFFLSDLWTGVTGINWLRYQSWNINFVSFWVCYIIYKHNINYENLY